MLKKIVSGGQTGADQAALDVAIDLGIDHGGWVPLGRKTENGVLNDQYRMQEMPTADYGHRTEQNVIDSEGTLILSHGRLTGGSEYTRKMAVKQGRPWLHVDLTRMSAFQAARSIGEWLAEQGIGVLNVAGPRASKDPRIYEATRGVLESAYYLGMVNDTGVLGTERPPPATDPRQRGNPPASMELAVATILSRLTLRDRHRIANMTPEDLPELVYSLEVYLRKEFGLPDRNNALVDSCRAASTDPDLPADQAPLILVRALWKELRRSHRLRIIK
jgi:Circularly permutated YpsA SLOG family